MSIVKFIVEMILQSKLVSICFLTCLGIGAIQSSYAQVTIGSGSPPVKAALLELKDKDAEPIIPSVTDDDNITSSTGGLILPRVKLISKSTLEPFVNKSSTEWISNTDYLKEKHAGLTVYNLNESNGFKQGIYAWDGSKWDLVGENSGIQFFYMPSFNLPVTSVTDPNDPDETFDLYKEYETQFTKQNNSHFVSNNTSLASVPIVYPKDRLDYVVTWYDSSIIEVIGIDGDGVMSYRILDTNTNPLSYPFMNIVLVIK